LQSTDVYDQNWYWFRQILNVLISAEYPNMITWTDQNQNNHYGPNSSSI